MKQEIKVCLFIVRLDANLPLKVTTDQVGTVIEAGAQVQQMITIECLREFEETPILHVQFS